MSRRPGRGWILIMALVTSLSVQAGPGIQMELTAGLVGESISGRPSEIEIRLLADSPVSVTLEVEDANGLTILPLQVDEKVVNSVWLPVTPPLFEAVRVSLFNNSAMIMQREVSFKTGQTPLAIISGTIPLNETGNLLPMDNSLTGVRTLILPAGEFPHTPLAYEGIEVLVADALSLSALSGAQYHALGDYLSRCNILLLTGQNPPALKQLQRIAGCNGRLVQNLDTLSRLPSMWLELSAQRPPAPPSAKAMLGLVKPVFKRQMMDSLYLYLAGYMVFSMLVMWRAQKKVYLLLIPVAVSASALLAWSGASSSRLVNWAETESGDHHARITGLLLLGGNRHGENRVSVKNEIGLSSVMPGSAQNRMRYHQNHDIRELQSSTRLLSPRIYQLNSVSRLDLPFSLQISNGLPRVVSAGNQFHTEARLLWRGRSYLLPALVQGESWQPTESVAGKPQSAPEQLLSQRLGFSDSALLLPFTSSSAEFIAGNLQSSGWLVIRAGKGQES